MLYFMRIEPMRGASGTSAVKIREDNGWIAVRIRGAPQFMPTAPACQGRALIRYRCHAMRQWLSECQSDTLVLHIDLMLRGRTRRAMSAE
jgi:hypothetical protein